MFRAISLLAITVPALIGIAAMVMDHMAVFEHYSTLLLPHM